TKVIIVLDHMSKDVLDGFDAAFSGSYGYIVKNREKVINNNADDFFSYHAVHSYNTGMKYILIVVTNDRVYATNILTANGCTKVNQIQTEFDPSFQLSVDALQLYYHNIKSHYNN